jgi:hypothetical protein
MKFLVTYHGGEIPSDPAELAQVKADFGAWLTEVGTAVTDPGAPVRALTQLAGGDPAPRSEIGGYTLIQAPSIEAAADVLKSHPFLSHGGTLQLNEILDF